MFLLTNIQKLLEVCLWDRMPPTDRQLDLAPQIKANTIIYFFKDELVSAPFIRLVKLWEFYSKCNKR